MKYLLVLFAGLVATLLAVLVLELTASPGQVTGIHNALRSAIVAFATGMVSSATAHIAVNRAEERMASAIEGIERMMAQQAASGASLLPPPPPPRGV